MDFGLYLASMSAQPDPIAFVTAEDVLRAIYGDDLKGCAVTLDSIAAIIDRGLQQTAARNGEWLELYEKVVEAMHILSTPPDKAKVTDPAELQGLLTQRLDAIHSVTTKTIQTLATVRGLKAED
jgi:hypothetical protein